MAIDFRNIKKLSIGGVELKSLAINGVQVWKSFTNMIRESINSDGTQYVGNKGEDGYKFNARLDTAGAEVAVTSDVGVTGFISVKKGDVLYFKNVQLHPTATGGKNELTLIGFYLSDFTSKACSKLTQLKNFSYIAKVLTTYADTGFVKSLEIVDTYNYGIKYIRFSCAFLDDTAIVTVNEPID